MTNSSPSEGVPRGHVPRRLSWPTVTAVPLVLGALVVVALVPASDRLALAQAKVERSETPRLSTQAKPALQALPALSQDAAAMKRNVESLLATGQVDASRNLFSTYLESAPARPERATLSLAYGNALAKAGKAGDQPALMAEAGGYLRFSFENGTDREQAVARNNYAAIALQQGRAEEALLTLQQGYDSAKALPDSTARARYLYNFGKAMERHGNAGDAIALYGEAYRADPRRSRAAEAGIDMAIRLRDLPAAADLLDLLVEGGHLALAEAAFETMIEDRQLARGDEFVAVVEALYDYLPAARIGPEAFAQSWRGRLRDLRGLLNRDAAARLDLIFLAYDRELPLIFDSLEVRERFAPWFDRPYDSRAAAEALARPSRFLGAMGEIYADQRDFAYALRLYATGWAMNTANLDAGLYAANLLLEYPQDLDPDGVHLQRFISNLFAGKGEAYLGEDLPNILRFHTILGTIFSKQERWGDSGSVRSAIFQWEHALEASDRLAEQGRSQEAAVPGLHIKLAEAYDAVGRQSDAFNSYLRAVDEALQLSNDELARRIIYRKIRTLTYTPDDRQLQRFDALRARIPS